MWRQYYKRVKLPQFPGGKRRKKGRIYEVFYVS
jgi:hypothetical protein